ncbi:MAG TPA: hypothetical protein PLV92_28305, partial [Pirellulaceae bacterium]|nr:hypothetical protein [Pirellulaceae bacterium]
AEREIAGEGASLWRSLEEPLRLREPPKLEAPHRESDWLNGAIESTHAQLRLPERFKPSQDVLAVATPYAVSPVVRRIMHRMIYGPKSPQPAGYAACEAPLALTFELLAQGRISPPWAGELITAAGQDLELTSVTIHSNAARELRVEFNSSLRCPAGTAESPSRLLAPSTTSATGASGVLFAAGAELASAARRIGALRRTTDGATSLAATIDVVDDGSVARGAARYAAYVSRRGMAARILGGWKSLSVTRVLPRTVGMITTNASGESFWRRLFRAGEPLVELSAELIAGPSNEGPSLCVLAEIAATDSPRLWLNRRDWDSAGLIIHSSHEVPRRSGSTKLRLLLKWREHLRLWDESFVRIAWQ